LDLGVDWRQVSVYCGETIGNKNELGFGAIVVLSGTVYSRYKEKLMVATRERHSLSTAALLGGASIHSVCLVLCSLLWVGMGERDYSGFFLFRLYESFAIGFSSSHQTARLPLTFLSFSSLLILSAHLHVSFAG